MYGPISRQLISQYAIPALLANFCSNAVSEEAEFIRRSDWETSENAERSIALFGRKDQAIAMISQMGEEFGEENWDGYGALPVSLVGSQTAMQFIVLLPDDFPMPDVSPEPDGSLALDWTTSKCRRLSVSFGNSDRIAYAWLDGSDRGHAVARFDGQAIPLRILDSIASITA